MSEHIVIVSGEASGDEHGAHLVAELKKLRPQARLSGIGGPAMASAGVNLLYRSEELALVGISEVLGKLKHIWAALKGMKALLRLERPDLLILIDFPDFNFRLAAYARKLGIKVLYYISPQVWAWRAGRAGKMANLVDHLAVVFPFEKDFYAKHAPDLPVTFVGHPLFDELADYHESEPWPFAQEQRVVGLLPGSRGSEITRLMPLMAQTARLLKAEQPDLKFALPVAPGLKLDEIKRYLADDDITLLPGKARQVMLNAEMLLVASGTATLQGAVAGVPMIVVYQTGGLNYFLGRKLIKVEHIAMPNLIAGYGLLPELIQDEANPRNLAGQALNLLRNPERLKHMRAELGKVREKLGGPGASRRVAELALNIIVE